MSPKIKLATQADKTYNQTKPIPTNKQQPERPSIVKQNTKHKPKKSRPEYRI